MIEKYKSVGLKSVSAALDMKAISASAGGGGGFGPGGIRGSGTPQIGGGAKAREALWQRMAGCMDKLHSVLVAVWHLQRVLSKKRDPFTHVLLLDEVIQVGGIGILSLFRVFLEISWSGIGVRIFACQLCKGGLLRLKLDTRWNADSTPRAGEHGARTPVLVFTWLVLRHMLGLGNYVLHENEKGS
ncbi:hypothetical protein L484_019446 [Morus notabilis]|uniref:Conserved oligomeric Golgi complex subunit 5 helical domain-containing protein n=1 Tax=Morus notabilis TaxID=981085 RepID=W9S4X4_9ROSA|nr:hypothetical protein L484_019446 [Morus notabilis]